MLAIEYIHSNGIILRDLKWDNIMIDSKGNAKLIDFDKTKIIEPNQVISDISFTGDIGSSYFSSPEQFMSSEYSFKSDIFSLGMIIQFILTEKKFYHDSDNLFINMQKRQLNALDLNIFPKYEYKYEQLESIFSECLEYSQDDRPIISQMLNYIFFTFSEIDIDTQLLSLL